MKTIGMLGGMSWESTQLYYSALNLEVKKHCGGLHSAKILLYSVDFAEIEELQHTGQWKKLAEILAERAKALEVAGADFLLICTNTMHKVAPEIEQETTIPLLHIADATANILKKDKCDTVGLLGTRFTMEQDFYKERLVNSHGIRVLVPEEKQRQSVHDIIYNELCQGKISEKSRERYLDIISELHGQGAKAVILGCTEITLLVKQEHTPIPLYDTTAIHAREAVKYALG